MKPVGEPDAGDRHVRFDERDRKRSDAARPKLPRLSSTLPNRPCRAPLGRVRKLGLSCQCCPRGTDFQQWRVDRPWPASIVTAARDPNRTSQRLRSPRPHTWPLPGWSLCHNLCHNCSHETVRTASPAISSIASFGTIIAKAPAIPLAAAAVVAEAAAAVVAEAAAAAAAAVAAVIWVSVGAASADQLPSESLG